MKYKPFQNEAVAAVFGGYPPALRKKLLGLRELIFQTASATPEVGELEETLKWGQPSYLPSKTKSGTTIRLDRAGEGEDGYGLYVHCQTSLVAGYRRLFPTQLRYTGNRGILFDKDDEVPT